MNDPFLMSMLNRLAHLDEKLQSLAIGKLVRIAVAADRLAGYVIHHEIRKAGVRGAGVEDTRHIGMIHHCQRLALGLKSRHYLVGVHARPDHFQRHRAPHGLLLLGQIHDPHPAATELADDAIAPDARGRRNSRGSGMGMNRRFGGYGAIRIGLAAQQALDFAAQSDVPSARVIEKSSALHQRQLQRISKDRHHRIMSRRGIGATRFGVPSIHVFLI